MATIHPVERLQRSLADISQLLERHRLLEALARQQEGPKRDLIERLQHRQNLVELQKHLSSMHVADVAYVLENAPLDDRQTIWEQVDRERAGLVFVEASDTVRASLIAITPHEDVVRMLTTLDAEDLAFVSESLPAAMIEEASRLLESAERSVFEASIQYPDETIGHYMTQEWISVPESHTVEAAIEELRRRGELPPQTDRVFVTDVRNILVGAVPLQALLVLPPATPVQLAVTGDTVRFTAGDSARSAVKAFERYDLVSAAVVDERGKLVGRLTVDAVMDVMRDQANLQALRSAGLLQAEDLFAGPLASARNRWPWLGVNLVTAFVASRVIGQFEGAIQSLAALAALMPVVASIGGNTGNQTMALVIRALAVDQLQLSRATQLLHKELMVSVLNGALWGLMVGVFAIMFYASVPLGLVMSSAVVLNLAVAAVAGVVIPLGLHAWGRDPAHGSSVLLTFITDAMGFFLFLGLASLFLL